MPKLNYNREALQTLYHQLPADERDEMAIPSYLHSNPLIRWLVTRRMNIILDLMDFKPGQSVLDFGCGVGMLLLQLPPKGGTYYGVDLQTWPAQQFLGAHNRSDVQLLNAATWFEQLAPASIDCVVALEVLEHVDDVPHLARLFRQTLKPDGRLVISGPTENAMYQVGRKIAGFSGEYHHRDIYEIINDIESAGFTPECHRKIPLPWPFTLFIAGTYSIK